MAHHAQKFCCDNLNQTLFAKQGAVAAAAAHAALAQIIYSVSMLNLSAGTQQ
jgi:hypothetical protein